MDTAELLRKVRAIEIHTRGLSRQLFAGEYHSAFKGQGMSFSEVRAYHYGDDVRAIDWNVTARTGSPHIKIFEEERELSLMLVVDISQSVYWGTGQTDKKNYLVELCAVLAFSALQNSDKVGLILFSDQIELFIPPKKGRKHVLRIIRELLHYEPRSSGTRIDIALDYLMKIYRKRGICIILSDWQATDYERPLRILARRHDVIAMRIYDPAERALHAMGLLRTTDPETGEQRYIDSSSARWRDRYHAQYQSWADRWTQDMRRYQVDSIALDSSEPYTIPLLRFFKSR